MTALSVEPLEETSHTPPQTALAEDPQPLIIPTEDEQRQAQEITRLLSALAGEVSKMQIITADGQSAPLPAPARRLLQEILRQMAAGHAVTVQAVPAELTIQQAADILHVSPDYIFTLLDAGELPFRQTGFQKSLLLADVIAYKQEDDARRHAALNELTALSQEMGLY